MTNVPPGHFAGVSAPCTTLSEARKSATLDIVRQVLGSMGVSYGYGSKQYVKGNVRGEWLQRNIEESLSGSAKGIVLGVERNIVINNWSKDVSGNFVYFILVRYPEDKILEMRRLSKGAKLIATSVSDPNTDEINIKVSEVNGVSVVLTSADIIIRQHNPFVKPISLFLWKVPAKVEHRSSIPLDSVKVCGNSAYILLSAKVIRKSIIDHLVGAHFETIVTLYGYDEIGRSVGVKIEKKFRR